MIPMGPLDALLVVTILGLVVYLFRRPRQKSMAEEKRELLEYFRRRDAAEARGEKYPPDEVPGGRLF